MDISQLCSDSPNQSPTSPRNKSDVSSGDQRVQSLSVIQSPSFNKPNSPDLQFLLSTTEQDSNENKKEGANNSLSSMLSQCGQLCDQIQHLKLYEATISTEERGILVDKLSASANALFRALQSVDMSRLKSSKCEMDIDKQEDETEDECELPSRSSSVSINKEHAEYELIRQARNLQNTHSTPKYRRRNRRNMIGQKCHSCNTTETPEWRRGPDGARTLCNACGLHYSKLLKKGSIGVQTHNYLMSSNSAARLPAAATARATTTLPPPSITSHTDNVHLRSQQQQVSKPRIADNTNSPQPKVNFPFVLMNPKYGIDKLHQRNQPLLVDHFQQQQQYSNTQYSNGLEAPYATSSHSSAQYHSNYTLRLPPVSSPAVAATPAPAISRTTVHQAAASTLPPPSLHPVNNSMNDASNNAHQY